MRFTSAAVLALWLPLASLPGQRSEPFVPIGVWYETKAGAAAQVLGDLQTIRNLGFNHIKTSVGWGAVEAVRGAYQFDALDQLLTLAEESRLKVIVQPNPHPAPAWVDTKAPDAGAVAGFVAAVSARAARRRSFHALDLQPSPFRVSMYPRPASGPQLLPVQLAMRFDELRSAARERGWGLASLQAGPAVKGADVSTDVTGADLRAWGWTAIARGARVITYSSWSSASSPSGANAYAMIEADGALTERARIAGEFAGIVSRNAALFAPLRPRPSRVAIAHDAAPEGGSGDPRARAAVMRAYERLFERNVQVDLIPRGAMAAGTASDYAVVLDLTAQPAALTQLDPLEPDIHIDPVASLVEARVLESSDVLMIVAVNHGDAPRTVTFTFTPDTPEAIWQNMETGASVSFVQGPDGLTYRHAFAGRDVMVLMIRKRLR